MTLKGGEGSVRKTVQTFDGAGVATPVKVTLTVTLIARKSVSGTVTFKTAAKACAAQNGKAKTFSAEFRGPVYGGDGCKDGTSRAAPSGSLRGLRAQPSPSPRAAPATRLKSGCGTIPNASVATPSRNAVAVTSMPAV